MLRQLAPFFAAIVTVVSFQLSNIPAADAATITGVSIEAFSSQIGGPFNRQAAFTVDGSGLSGAVGSEVHNTTPDGFMWLTNAAADPNGAGKGSITFDLGANYDLSSFKVWNYNEAGQFLSRGAQSVQIAVAETDVGPSFVDVGGPTAFPIANGAGETGDILALVASNVRLVRFDILLNHGDLNYVGLSEVQFDGVEAAEVPEPATFLMWSVLGVVGFGGYLVRRRLQQA